MSQPCTVNAKANSDIVLPTEYKSGQAIPAARYDSSPDPGPEARGL